MGDVLSQGFLGQSIYTYVAAVLVAGIVFIVASMVMKRLHDRANSGSKIDFVETFENYFDGEDELSEARPDLDAQKSGSVGLRERWNIYWQSIFSALEWNSFDSPEKSGNFAFIVLLVLAGAISVFTGMILAGPIISCIIAGLAGQIVSQKDEKKQEAIFDQLPGFLFSLKASIQANESIENAFVRLVDQVESPLYDEILPAKQRVLAGEDFISALRHVLNTTRSRELKQFLAYLIQAVENGSNVEYQLEQVYNVLKDRQELNALRKENSTEAKMTLNFVTFLIPATFIILYIGDSRARDFWFKSWGSWITFVVVLILYFIALFLTKREIDKIKNM